MKKKIELIMAVILPQTAGFLANALQSMCSRVKLPKHRFCIIIDAGHGGDVSEKSVSMEKKKRS